MEKIVPNIQRVVFGLVNWRAGAGRPTTTGGKSKGAARSAKPDDARTAGASDRRE